MHISPIRAKKAQQSRIEQKQVKEYVHNGAHQEQVQRAEVVRVAVVHDCQIEQQNKHEKKARVFNRLVEHKLELLQAAPLLQIAASVPLQVQPPHSVHFFALRALRGRLFVDSVPVRKVRQRGLIGRLNQQNTRDLIDLGLGLDVMSRMQLALLVRTVGSHRVLTALLVDRGGLGGRSGRSVIDRVLIHRLFAVLQVDIHRFAALSGL